MPYMESVKSNTKQCPGQNERHTISAFYRKQQAHRAPATPCSLDGSWVVTRSGGNAADACTHAVGGRRSKYHIAAHLPDVLGLGVCQILLWPDPRLVGTSVMDDCMKVSHCTVLIEESADGGCHCYLFSVRCIMRQLSPVR